VTISCMLTSIIGLLLPIHTARPPNRNAVMACCTEGPAPTASMAASTPLPPVSSRILALKSWLFGFMTASAPISPATLKRWQLKSEIRILPAFFIFTHARASSPMVPAPTINTVFPSSSPACSTLLYATANGSNREPIEKETLSDKEKQHFAGTQIYSANAPSTSSTPKALLFRHRWTWPFLHISQFPQKSTG